MKKSLDIIRKTIKILDSVSYENYSDGKARTYLEYMEGHRTDEDRLISPILLRKFLQEILGFELGQTIATQEYKAVGKPDYIPVDTRTHPFVLDAKGTDTQDLSQHYPQIKKYIESRNLKYGILTNMRDLDVYTEEQDIEIEDYNFNFVQLYKDYKKNIKLVLNKENTKRFLNFVERFGHQKLTLEDKIRLIAEAKPWKGVEELNSELLTQRLRAIVEMLYEDVKNRKKELTYFLEANPDKARNIAQEVEIIVSEMLRGREAKEATPELFQEILNTPEVSLYGRALNSFFYRIAYFTMTRLLLARTWEDIGFIDQSLYDGGFKKWYENFNHEISRVLRNAFGFAAERYPWLFNVDNNYSWYEPSDNALINSLYELSNFNLAGLNQDILGSIYEEYIDRIDKKNKGQYYTPREIVSLIWDRVGYTNSNAFFWHIEGKRRPKPIFDPATGSGGFLVEAARRIREESGIDFNDYQDLWDIRYGILYYIFGAEISIFPYYITEVNLLIQLTPILKQMMRLRPGFKERTPLGVVRVDALSLYNFKDALLKEQDKATLEDKTIDILPLDSQKRAVFDKIREKFDGKFSYCCANPPYVGEKGHKELFRYALRSYPYWMEYYQGKMDYLYWFIILGLSKLRNYGKLGFITSAYWPTADGASKLRKYILENAKIKEMIFFEEVKIFEHAKGQHNMVFVLTKCSGEEHKEERENNYIKIARVKCKNQDLPGTTIRENLNFLTKHIQKYIDKPKYEDRYIKVFWSGVKQGELAEDAWDLKYSLESNTILNKIEKLGKKIGNFLHVGCGVLTNRDYVTTRNIKRLTQSEIEHYGIKLGDGIFVLSEEEYHNLPLSPRERKIIKPWYKNSEVSRYIPDPYEERRSLIYLRNKDSLEEYPTIKAHLIKFKGILDYQLLEYGETNKWYAVTRASENSVLKREKIFTPYRAKENTFAYSNADFFSSKDLYYITYRIEPPNIGESLKYVLGVLNSSTIEFWCLHKLKQKGNVREYYATPLKNIPIHRINFNDSKEVKLHNEIVDKVKSIREKMAKLARYSKYFSGPRLTRLKFDEPLPKVNDEAIIKSLASENVRNLRTHPEVKIGKSEGFEEDKFYLNKVEKPELILTGNAQLKLKGKDKTSVFIEGPYELLKLLFDILPNWGGKPWSEIKENLLLPDIIASFNAQKSKILNEVRDVRTKVLQLQKEIDQIVYKLYGLTSGEIKLIEKTVR